MNEQIKMLCNIVRMKIAELISFFLFFFVIKSLYHIHNMCVISSTMDSVGKFNPGAVPIWRTSSFAGEFGDSHIENTNLQVSLTFARFY